VDGTDFAVPQPRGQKRRWYSKKLNRSGVRYEVGICLLTGDIVWIQGPYPCGDWPDIKIFRQAMIHNLEKNERVEADDGYVGEHPRRCKIPSGFSLTDPRKEKLQKRVRSRQETVNARFKFWGCLRQRFRHAIKDVSKHSMCFRAVAVITQLEIEHGEPLFKVQYRDI